MLTMLATAAEVELDLLVERIQAGLPKAKQQGNVLGRPVTITPEQCADIPAKCKSGTSISELSPAAWRLACNGHADCATGQCVGLNQV